MLKILLIAILPFITLFGIDPDTQSSDRSKPAPSGDNGTLEKLIPANGTVQIDLDLRVLNGKGSRSAGSGKFEFQIKPDSFFSVLTLDGELRGPLPGSMDLIPHSFGELPGRLNSSLRQLSVEKAAWGTQYDLAVRDAKTGFVFFNIEGHEYGYDADVRQFTIEAGRLLLSSEFATELGNPALAGRIVGSFSMTGTMRPIEITQVVDGEVVSNVMPANDSQSAGSVPGPDVIVGDLSGLAQFGSASGGYVGLAVGTDSCNLGQVELDWYRTPDNNHPVIPQNLYRMSGGTSNSERFEQIGQSNVKHAFTALQNNLCNLGCVSSGTGTRLGSGCSDPYGASLNSGPNLGSRAWINPFTGAFPRADSPTPPNNHTGHTHDGTSHRVLVAVNNLNTSMNAGAQYFVESQYVTPHEYVWCAANPTQCNMYNNASYRRYTVNGTASPFSFSAAAPTVQKTPAIAAWTGATLAQIQPAPGVDGIGTVAYKVTNTAANVWHYEYAIYNQNLDRGIQSFSVPIPVGVTITNIGFSSPPQHPGWANDGTFNSAGYSSTPWTVTQTATSITWSSETFAQNPNANAIRWGTMYTFRFDANRAPSVAGSAAPAAVNSSIGFLKTGAPITVPVEAPVVITAAGVAVSGRVVNSAGAGLRNVRISMTDGAGNVSSATSNAFGYFQFEDIPAGGTYTMTATNKRYTFAPRVLTVNESVEGLEFVAQ